MVYFLVRYNSRVVIYDHKMFIRLETCPSYGAFLATGSAQWSVEQYLGTNFYRSQPSSLNQITYFLL